MGNKEYINYKTLGERVKNLRNDNQLTQEQLADKINVSPNFISKIESNNSSVSLNTLISLTKALNTSMDYLLFDSIEHEKTINDVLIESLLKNFSEIDKEFIATILKGMQIHRLQMQKEDK